jgi:hypothetical protein
VTGLRVIGPDVRLTRLARSWVSAEERARRVTLLVGSAEIQCRDQAGAWQTIERFINSSGRVNRQEVRP